MQKYIYISIGGALGSVLRLLIGNAHIGNYNGIFPLNTLAINIVGTFTLALFLTVAYEIMEIDADLRLGVSTGFLGAFTTFSTFCKETASLMTGGEYFTAVAYITISAILGLAAAYLGMILARETVVKLMKENRESQIGTIDEKEGEA